MGAASGPWAQWAQRQWERSPGQHWPPSWPLLQAAALQRRVPGVVWVGGEELLAGGGGRLQQAAAALEGLGHTRSAAPGQLAPWALAGLPGRDGPRALRS